VLRNLIKPAALANRAICGPCSTNRGLSPSRSKALDKHPLVFEPLEPRLALSGGPLLISEFLAINDAGLMDADDDCSDWIEIHNPTGLQVGLGGWYLTDDDSDLTKWGFPDLAIDPGEYLVVFASGKDRSDPGELHTNFQIDGAGEYLALVGPDGFDGVAVCCEFAPEFPQQYADVSYGLAEEPVALALEGSGLAYRVPDLDDGQLATSWTALGFDDSAWSGFPEGPQVLITEAGTVADFAEIQNISAEPVDTAGWVVVANNSIGREPDINKVHNTLWPLPDALGPGEVLYRHDDPDEDPDDETYHDSYWGETISWKTTGPGWIAIVDEVGTVVDFVVWGYSGAEIASLAVNVNGFEVTAADAWFGESVEADGARDHSLQRRHDGDSDNLHDWAFVEGITMGQQNAELTVPFSGHRDPSIGFEQNPPGLGGEVAVKVEEEMYDLNASLWMRVPFEVDTPGGFDSMQLQIKYNDGFVAYLNGHEVARRNAPQSLAWNSTATDNVEGSWQFEQIDLSEFVHVLRQGSNVLAIHGLNVDPADGNFLIWPQLVVSGAEYFDPPSPTGANGAGFLGFVGDTRFSVDRGFYDNPFWVEITSGTPGATIYYTTDGSLPSETNGEPYSLPIQIGTTTTLRAIALKPGYEPTNVDTQTYIFPNHVATQTRPDGYPTSWGGEPSADYAVDQSMSMSGQYHDRFIAGLTSIPSMSLVLPMEDMFGGGGLYSNTQNKDLEKVASAELIYPDDTGGFQIDAGLKIQGGASRTPGNAIKHSLSLRFRNVYGAGRLDFPLFDDSPVNSFDAIHLRAMYNNSWIHWSQGQRDRGSMIRDQWMRDSLLAMGQEDAGRGDYVHLYINGLYWGVYNIHERQEAAHYADYNGGDEHRLDAIKNGEAVDGTKTSWNALHTLVANGAAGGINLTEYAQIGSRLDLVGLIDYMIVNHYGANSDWDHHNWRAAGGGQDDAPWKVYSWDAERVLEATGADRTGVNNSGDPSRLFHNLRNGSPEFRLLFADRLHKHFFNGGALTPERAADRWMQRANTLDLAIGGESARWGDDRPGGPYTRDNQWIAEQSRLINSYFPLRSNNVMNRYRGNDLDLYPDVDAPVFYVEGTYRHGGLIAPSDRLTMPATSGKVYYTLDGSDPRLPGGGISSLAGVFSGTSVLLADSGFVKARALSGGEWSALNEAQFLIDRPATAENLVVSEINYDPYEPTQAERTASYTDNDDFEFIELYNTSDETIYLGDLRFTAGIDFEFSQGGIETLAAGERVVVARNPVAFQGRYGTSANVVGGYDTKLDNSGERIALSDRFGEPIFDFAYATGGPWPGRANGNGSSLELIDPAAVPQDAVGRTLFLETGTNWRSSSEYGGSPGVEGQGPRGDVLINEVLTHTDPPDVDSIELYNATTAAIHIGGWYLSDSNNLYEKFCVPETTISPGGYVVFDEHDFNSGAPQPGSTDFALNGAHGDDVWLVEADQDGNPVRFVDRVEFPAAANGESFGRWPDGSGELYPMLQPTLNPAGVNSGPRVGEVVVSEVQYNPAGVPGDDDLEFVEIYNTSSATVELTNWRIRKGIDFDFAAGTMLAPHAALVVVPFNLSEIGKLDYFCDHYRIGGDIDGHTVQIVGGFVGVLDNGGERVQLQRPDEPPVDEPDFIPRLIEDEVRYFDHAPWPIGADGTGRSLSRVSNDDWGNYSTNWVDAAPSPGTVLTSGEAQVVGRYVFYNDSSGFDPSPADTGDNAIAIDKTALLPGRTADFSNYTSYASGINGLMIDVAGLPDAAVLDGNDFEFHVGNGDNPSTWVEAPLPTTITVRPGVGYGGSARVTIAWTDGVIKNEWLQVKVLDTANTDLPSPDVFYFGNAVGESGNSIADARVNAADGLLARNNPRGFLNSAPIDFRFDFNRDARVNATDMLIARNNQTHLLDALELITAPDDTGKKDDPRQEAVDELLQIWPS